MLPVTDFRSVDPGDDATVVDAGVSPRRLCGKCDASQLWYDHAVRGRGCDHLMPGLRLLGVNPRACIVHEGADSTGDRHRCHGEHDREDEHKGLDAVTTAHQRATTEGLNPPTVSQTDCEGFHDVSSTHRSTSRWWA